MIKVGGSKRSRSVLLLVLSSVLVMALVYMSVSQDEASDYQVIGGEDDWESRSTRQSTGCEATGCHVGIEPISDQMDFSCDKCHSGNDESTNKTVAHDGMYPNPGDMAVVDDTCGACHPELVERLKKSMHATSAGIISASRYTWGAQDRDSEFANYEISDEDGEIPDGAVDGFDQIPTFGDSGEPVDDYLRNQCLRCHIWTEGKKVDGDYRSSGCSAWWMCTRSSSSECRSGFGASSPGPG
jgi:hypothetical protein